MPASPSPSSDPIILAWLGLGIGASTALALLLAPQTVARIPFGLLGSAALLAWGLLAGASLVEHHLERDLDDAAIGALIPYLGIPTVARRLGGSVIPELPVGFQAPLILEVLSVGTGLVLLVGATRLAASRRRVDPAWVVAGTGLVVLLGGLTLLPIVVGDPPPGAVAVLAITVLIVGVALGLQRGLARASDRQGALAFASVPALAVAGAQLLDGVVSYLAVADPLGLLAGGFDERVPLSAFLIETTGPGFALIKWAIALVAVHYLDGPGRGVDEVPSVARVGTYLLIAMLGLGPGLFSATALLV